MSTTRDHVEILLEIRDKLDGLSRTQRGLKDTESQLTSLSNALRMGFGIDVAGRVMSTLQQIPQVLQSAIREGIRFNSVMESSQLGMAAVLKATNPERFGDFNEGLRMSSKILDEIKDRAKKTAASFEGLVGAFQSLAAPMNAAGVPLSRQVEFAAMIADAVRGLGMPEDQIAQEGRSLLEGRIDRTVRLARMIPGLTRERIQEATREGRTFEFFKEKLDAFAEAGRRGADSWAILMSNLGDVYSQNTAEETVKLFTALKDVIREMTKTLDEPETKTGFRALANFIQSPIQYAMRLKEAGDKGMDWAVSGLEKTGASEKYRQRFKEAWMANFLSPYIPGYRIAMRERWAEEDRVPRAGQTTEGAPPTGARDAAEASRKLKESLELGRDALQFDYAQRLIDLKDYLAARKAQIDESLKASLLTEFEAAKQLQDLDQEKVKATLKRTKATRLDTSNLSDVLFRDMRGSSSGLAAHGIFTTRSGYYSETLNVSRNMLRVLIDLRDLVADRRTPSILDNL